MNCTSFDIQSIAQMPTTIKSFTVISIQFLICLQLSFAQTPQVKELNDRAESFHDDGQFDSLWKYAHLALVEAESIGDIPGLIDATNNIGTYYYQGEKANMDSALSYFERANTLANQYGYTEAEVIAGHNIVAVYSRLGEFNKVIDMAISFLAQWDDLEDEDLKTEAFFGMNSDIATSFIAMGELEKAMAYFQACRAYVTDVDRSQLAGNLAYLNIELGDYQQALEYLDEALIFFEYSDLTKPDSVGLVSFQGKSLYFLGEYDRAENVLEAARAGSIEVGDSYFLVYTLNMLGDINYRRGDFKEAGLLFKEAIDKSFFLGMKAERLEALEGAYLSMKSTNQIAQALEFHEQYQLLKDSIFETSKSQQIAELETKYQADQKDQQLQVQEAKLDTQITQRNALLAGLGFLGIISLLVFRSQRLKARSNKELALKNEQIRLAEETKTRWFVNVSHELKTPLTLVQGPLQSLIERRDWDEMSRKDLQMADRNVKQLNNLVSQILDLSRVEGKSLTLQRSTVNLSHILKSTVAAFDSLARRNQIRMTLKVEQDVWMDLDGTKIRQLFENLISNALKFTHTEGEVAVELETSSEMVKVVIRDTGEGISKEDLPFVFDRFFQSKDDTKSKIGGTGIGLSLAKEVIEMHSGAIEVESEVGIGSRFIVSLPATLVCDQPETLKPEHEHVLKESLEYELYKSRLKTKPVLLLAEDNDDMRDYMESILKFDYDLVLCRDGKDALERLRKTESVDLIISDMMMPRMDGLNLIREVKKEEKWSDIPIIILTALDTDSTKITVLRTGVDDYLTKPFNPDELKVRASNLLQNKATRIESGGSDLSSYDDGMLGKLEKLIQQHIDDSQLSVVMLADHVSMSESSLRRYLKRTVGLSPLAFIQEIKLHNALNLLEKQVYTTLKEVALKSGFDRTSRFTDAFKNRFGKNPSDYMHS